VGAHAFAHQAAFEATDSGAHPGARHDEAFAKPHGCPCAKRAVGLSVAHAGLDSAVAVAFAGAHNDSAFATAHNRAVKLANGTGGHVSPVRVAFDAAPFNAAHAASVALADKRVTHAFAHAPSFALAVARTHKVAFPTADVVADAPSLALAFAFAFGVAVKKTHQDAVNVAVAQTFAEPVEIAHALAIASAHDQAHAVARHASTHRGTDASAQRCTDQQ